MKNRFEVEVMDEGIVRRSIVTSADNSNDAIKAVVPQLNSGEEIRVIQVKREKIRYKQTSSYEIVSVKPEESLTESDPE